MLMKSPELTARTSIGSRCGESHHRDCNIFSYKPDKGVGMELAGLATYIVATVQNELLPYLSRPGKFHQSLTCLSN